MDNASEKKHAGRPCDGVRFAFDTAPSLVAKLPLPRPQDGVGRRGGDALRTAKRRLHVWLCP